MDTDRTEITPEQAREQLAAIEGTSLRAARDRQVHALGTAILGLSIGLLMAPANVVSGLGRALLYAAYTAAWVGGAMYVERAARTVPRRARLWSRLGLGASFAIALFAVLPWLNWQHQTAPNTWTMVLAGLLAIAAPSLLAAGIIARGRR